MDRRIFLMCAVLIFSQMPLALADQTEDEADVIELIIGDLETIPVRNLTRLSVTDPEIADIADAKGDKVLVLGKKTGQTEVFLWDDTGKHSVKVRVVSENLSTVKARVQKILEKTDIKGVSLEENASEGKVVTYGALSKEEKAQLDKVLEPYGDKILNLVKEEANEDLVQVDMQVTELSTTLTKNMGVEWTNSGAASGTGIQLAYKETLPETNGKPEDFFKIGDFNRTPAIMATVNALLREGKARILSKPRLVVVSGKEASFLVGGEIPIRSITTSSTGGSQTQNITFKQYGVNMTITPTVREGKVDILLNAQISDIDSSTKTVSGDAAFITRSAQTQLFMDDGQTIVLAGLIKHNDSKTADKLPFLSKVPILGLLFRNNNSDNKDTELVISLTPTILKNKKYATQETTMPTPGLRQLSKDVESNYEHTPLKAGPNKVKEPTPPAISQGLISLRLKGGGVTPYARSIQEKISQSISYPQEAMENNWEGTVKLKLQILKDGTLAAAEVMEASGHQVFDDDALNTAKTAAPYPAFGAGMNQEDLIVTIPIIYSQGSAANKAQTVVPSY